MKRNSAALCIFLLHMLVITATGQKQDLILHQSEDSCFCVQYSLPEEENIMAPKRPITGLDVFPDSILFKDA